MENNNHHIDRIFKNGLKHYSAQPSADLWNRIADELDNGMPAKSSRAQWYRYAAMFLVLLSVALISVPGNRHTPPAIFAFDNNTGNSYAAPISHTAMPSFTALIPEITQVVADNISLRRTPSESVSFENPVQQITTADLSIKTHPKDAFIYLPAEPENETLAAASQDVFDRFYNNDEPIDVMAYNYFGDDDPEADFFEAPSYKAKYRDYDMRGLYIGATGSYNQTSLLESGNVFKGERPIQPSLKFGTTKGLRVGYNINNSFGIEAEYVYNALQGQNYVMSEGDDIVEKSLSLNYDLIPVVAKVKIGHISDITNKPVVLNYTAGVQYGMLREARMPQDKRYEESAMELFKETDVSVVLGLEYDVFVQDNIVISVGARGTFSNDISTHIEPLNDYAKRNFVFGLHGGVSYVFR